jgi:nicotinamidase-related amidase
MKASETALLLIGYQNDYFAPDGVLTKVIEEAAKKNNVLDNTVRLLNQVKKTDVLLVSTPIHFTPTYDELVEPIGILKVIKDTQAFKQGTKGAETIPELKAFGDRIVEVPGKRGLNAYSNTNLAQLFADRGIKNVVLAGAVTSICIDSTARSSFEQGFRVSVLSDCTTGRTMAEQDFYCSTVFPLYAEVLKHGELATRLGVA